MDDEQKTLEKLPRRFEHFPFGRSTSHPPCSLPHLIAPSSSAASVDTNADVPIGSDSFHQTRLTTDTTNPNNTALSEERNQEQDNLTERKPTQRTFRMVNIPNEYTLKDIRRLFPDARAITGCSLAQSPYSDSTKVATISFNEIPPALRMKSNETQRRIQFSPNGLCSFEAIVDDHFWGLTPLNDLTGDTRMDLIAVTGLAGHAYGSWKERGGNTMWLRDLVPEDIPTIRVLTYGFNSVLVGSKSTSSIRQFAKTFLEDVLNTRETSDGKQRPLIFIGHSLGGLIVKEAIAAAAKAAKDPKRTYGALLTSVYGAIFFGVPNRGLKIDELVHMVKGQPNERLVRDLAPRSEFLEMLHETFCERFDFNDTEVISFYETEETKTVKRNEIGQWTRDGPSVILVEKVSAVDTVPNEAKHNQIPIDRDHSNIVKFTGRSDTYYVTLRRHLKRFAADGPAVIKRRLDLGILPGMPTVMTSTSTENIPPPVPEESSKAAASNIALDMNREDNVGLTTLMRTVLRQDEQEVKLLLENKTDPTVADLGGRTPLHYALQIGNMKIAKLLLDNGADINASNYAASFRR
ncbi:hypothetical protein BDD12DRAFT_535075 [Trichophaea hybrida]|nr:hypothetical protein BDD12DRAFT_535075 [Trichophaea hybrida]